MGLSEDRIGQLVEEWLRVDQNTETRKEISTLWAARDLAELEKRLGSRIEFGTAGLRSRMEAGFSRMNAVTVLQASQGLAKYVEKTIQNGAERGVVIGHDHRHHSRHFAELAALAFVQLGFKVYALGQVHTPMVPFAVDTLKASSGVMVTASHNPAIDNGYKVYWANGCQIIPPHDSKIAASIDANLEPWSWDLGLLNSPLVERNITASVTVQYFAKLLRELNFTDGKKTPGFRFVYTPMHGVGLPAMRRAAGLLGLEDSMVVVPQQADPDPDFVTVKFPNPEEKGALDLAMELADSQGIKLILANDPDADRFVAAVKRSKWVQLTGNQLGSLFADFVTKQYSEKQRGVSRLAIVNSTVSSEFNAHVAARMGFRCDETLTGFKWIGNRAIDLEAQGYDVPFGYEEALGYMFSTVHDKDGISAAFVFMQMAGMWAMQGTDAVEKMQLLYRTVGYFAEYNSYYVTASPAVTDQVFAYIRSLGKSHDSRASPGANGVYPGMIGPYKVEYWRDLTTGYDSSTPDHAPTLPVSPLVQMITVKLSTPDSGEGVRFTARGSGTEPKLKVYIEGHASSAERAQELAVNVWQVLKEQWFRPDVTGLVEQV
ncbi:phosphoribomutase [Trichomonascus vanleenenianus]|uniref:phosphoribomutase PRM15 n=1 Tax=Trichomonascus vanleenenianus TaxID=2268995 RepID=UPI003ECB0036